jgi:glyoxylase-like metal-dependent hydrolase (beta-lactamase superfamily II)
LAKFIQKHDFQDVTGFEVGYAPVGSPLMNVLFYQVEDLLLDTGQSHMGKTVLSMLKERRVRRIFLTHHHEDHSGNASLISGQKNIPVYAHEETAQKLSAGFKIMPYQMLLWGRASPVEVLELPEVIPGEKITLLPVHTPGHSKDHTVYYEKERGWLFSGDLYLGSRIKFFRADEKVYETISSLRKVLKLDFDTLFCGHNPKLKEGKKYLKEKHDYLENLCGEIRTLGKKGLSVKEIKKALSRKENLFIYLLTFGNASFSNLVRSALKGEND